MDLQTDAVRLCIALQSQLNPAFLAAANDLLSCARLPPPEFHRHSRKIVRLIEIARDRLEASGISLFLFTSCQKGKYKDVYFDLLRMLQTRRCDIDVTLQARTNSLLIRLTSNFVGRHSAMASQILPVRISIPETTRLSLAMGLATCTPQLPKSTAACIAMPPPDAFPPSSKPWSRHRKRPRQSLSFLTPEAVRPRKRARRNSTDSEQENQVPAPQEPSGTYAYKSPPLTRRFGIFCTGKNSMHRPRSVRAY